MIFAAVLFGLVAPLALMGLTLNVKKLGVR